MVKSIDLGEISQPKGKGPLGRKMKERGVKERRKKCSKRNSESFHNTA